MNPFKIILALLLFNLSCASAENYQPICPPTIDVEQTLKKTPDGWAAGIYGGTLSDHEYALMNIEFSDGNPAKQSVFPPDSGKKGRGIDVETWSLTPKTPDGYWISCEYRETSVILTKKLPDNIKSCSVTFDTRYSNPVAKSVTCK